MTLRIAVAIACVGAAIAASTVTTPAAISDPVRTRNGQLSGVTLPSGVRVFKGIPFGAPPVGDLRWKEPQPAANWNGVRKAEQWGNVCVQPPQPTRPNPNVAVDLPGSPPMSEDCLYLNVWTNANRANDRLPVMVWIFGGAFSEGGGNSPHNDGENLARKGAVVVTFNYRLGAFGFFAHPELTKESGRNASGNQAMADSIATLRWVKDNIAAFGGDPGNVTIFGESAGATMVGGLVGSPVARGLFQRAVAQSGTWMGLGVAPMQTRAAAEAAATGRGRGGAGGRGGRGGAPAPEAAPAQPAAPPPPPPTLAELRARSTEEVVKTGGRGGMIIDGYIIPEDLTLTFAAGRQNAVDVIAGSNKDEHTTMGNQVAMRDGMAFAARLFAERQAALGRKAWWYHFTHEPPLEPGVAFQGATHAAEMVYVFNNLHAARMIPDRSSPKLAMASAKDRAIADQMSSYWVNFAKNGDPNGRGLPRWEAFTNRTREPHFIGEIKQWPGTATLETFVPTWEKIVATLKSPAN